MATATGDVAGAGIASSLQTYESHMHLFGQWLAEEQEEEAWKSIATKLDSGKYSFDPVLLNEHRLEPFICWLRFKQARLDSNGEPDPVSMASLKRYRCGLLNRYIQLQVTIPESLETELSTAYKELAYRDASSGLEVEAVLPFDVFKTAMTFCQMTVEARYRWCGAMLILQWATCSQVLQAAQIHLDHIGWTADCLLIRSCSASGAALPQHKTHVFANPLEPALCAVLNLALYLVEFGDSTNELLFPGSTQADRYCNVLKDLWQEPEMRAALLQHGLRPNQLGSISVSEGATSFGCSGTPQGGDMLTMCYRASGIVLQRYAHAQAAGDCASGRTLAGLPTNRSDFGVLPPHWPPGYRIADVLVEAWFPSRLLTRPNLVPVLRMCAAQIVYHYEHLKVVFGPSHPLRKQRYFDDATMAEAKSRLVTGLSSPHMPATGVPAWCHVAQDLDRLTEEAQKQRVEVMKSYQELRIGQQELLRGQLALAAQQKEFHSEVTALLKNMVPHVESLLRREGSAATSVDMRSQSRETSGERQTTNPDAVSHAARGLLTLAPVRREPFVSVGNESFTPAEAAAKLAQMSAELELHRRQDQEREEAADTAASKAASSSGLITAPLASSATPAAVQRTLELEARRLQEESEAAFRQQLVEQDGIVVDVQDGTRKWIYHDHVHRVPKSWKFPTGTLDFDWQLWMLGDQELKIAPFRSFLACDLRSMRRQRIHSEWRKVFSVIERFLRMKGSFKEHPTPAEARAMFEEARPFVKHLRARFITGTAHNSARPIRLHTLSRKMKVLDDSTVEGLYDEVMTEAVSKAAASSPSDGT